MNATCPDALVLTSLSVITVNGPQGLSGHCGPRFEEPRGFWKEEAVCTFWGQSIDRVWLCQDFDCVPITREYTCPSSWQDKTGFALGITLNAVLTLYRQFIKDVCDPSVLIKIKQQTNALKRRQDDELQALKRKHTEELKNHEERYGASKIKYQTYVSKLAEDLASTTQDRDDILDEQHFFVKEASKLENLPITWRDYIDERLKVESVAKKKQVETVTKKIVWALQLGLCDIREESPLGFIDIYEAEGILEPNLVDTIKSLIPKQFH
ncbi:hypothetical protein HK102_008328 [Quaeritorhiza haematococci]|nr:hypothetical protein HK102_008328 [Quaeritorhiza haematococci]